MLDKLEARRAEAAAKLAVRVLLLALISALYVLYLRRFRHDAYLKLTYAEADSNGKMPESTVSDSGEICAFSAEAYDFCLANGLDVKKAYSVSLLIEEIGTNVLRHGAKQSKRSIRP